MDAISPKNGMLALKKDPNGPICRFIEQSGCAKRRQMALKEMTYPSVKRTTEFVKKKTMSWPISNNTHWKND